MWINKIKNINPIIPNIYKNVSNGLFLDLYPNSKTAYSVRKLRTAYSGFCMQIRRSSDNSTLNVGFVNNYVDTTAISTFCGTGQGFVTIFYDQSGNGNNAIQNTAVSQPRIYNNGLNLTNGKLSLLFDGTNDYLQFQTSITGLTSLWENYMVAKRQSLSFASISGSATQGGLSPHFVYTRADNRWTFTTTSGTSTNLGRTYTSASGSDSNLNLRQLFTQQNTTGGTGNAYINQVWLNSSTTPTNSTTTYTNINCIGVERTTYGFGNLCENVFYKEGASGFNTFEAMQNQMTYYGI